MKKKEFVKIISSFFYIGYVPFFGGTAASFVTLFLYLYLVNHFAVYLIFLIILIILGLLFKKESEDVFGFKDPPEVVIDEVIGMLIALFMMPATFKFLALGFIIFRVFDIIKPYPANRIEDSSSRFSIIGDDIIAAIYTNLILQIIKFFS